MTFRVDVWNQGNIDATATEVRDLLPTDFSCTDVSSISERRHMFGRLDHLDGPHRPGGDPMGAGLTLTYDLSLPSNVTAGDNWTNTAGVAAYQGATNQSGTFDYFPSNTVAALA
ncbi:MAG: hypothetical protein R2710_24660 [Acidimicrobiales bacterium]